MDATIQRSLFVAIAMGLILIIAGQALAGAVMPAPPASLADAAGRASFAYLTGVRTFAAAVLWNRLEPIFHDYYQDVPLGEQLNVLPMIRMVNWLDPQHIDGYYIAAWIMSQRGEVDEAYEIAEAGVEANPDSGILGTNYAQILFLNGDTAEALVQAERAFAATQWRDDIEKHDNFGVLAVIFRSAGDTVMQQRVEAELELLDKALEGQLSEEDHDHDGDGVPDH